MCYESFQRQFYQICDENHFGDHLMTQCCEPNSVSSYTVQNITTIIDGSIISLYIRTLAINDHM